MSEAFKQRIRNEVMAYNQYMPFHVAVAKVKRNYRYRLDLIIDQCLINL